MQVQETARATKAAPAGWPDSNLHGGTTRVPRPDTRWFRHELTPAWLATTSLLAGYRPPDLTRPFRLAWFGCRAPLNAAVAAAVHPSVDVLAWDPEPSGLITVRNLRDEAELTNLQLHERPSPPTSSAGQFDMMVIDRLVDAVDNEQRTLLLDAAASQLRPGGLLCITYRTVVGWGEFVPIVRLLRHAVTRTSRDVSTSVTDALVLLDIFRERNVGYLSHRPMVRAWVDALLESGTGEVIAEYVQRDLCPASHAQITHAMARAGGSFVGSALLDDDLPEGVPEELATLVHTAPSRVLRESLSDLVLRRSSRADLLTLGGLVESSTAHKQRLKRLSLTTFGVDPRYVDQRPDLSQQDPVHSPPPTNQLTSQCQTAGELWAEVSAKKRQQMLQRALRSGSLHPVGDGTLDPQAVAASARLTHTLNGTGTPKAQRHVVAPLVGSAVPAGLALDTKHRRFLQGEK